MGWRSINFLFDIYFIYIVNIEKEQSYTYVAKYKLISLLIMVTTAIHKLLSAVIIIMLFLTTAFSLK